MSMRYIVTKGISAVKNELTSILANEIKKEYVKTSWNNYQLVIEIKKMGLSKIFIALNENGDKVQIDEIKREIAFVHKPFATEVEKMVEDIMVNKLGAKKA